MTNETHPAPTAAQLEQAAAERALAAGAQRSRQESQDRSDTDGFLSQWASGLTAQEHAARAEVLEHGGCAKFIGLYRDGKRVPAKLINGKWGARWMICDATTGHATGEFHALGSTDEHGQPVNSKRTKLVRAGYEERIEWAIAVVFLNGSGTGLSGSAWVATQRDDGGWPGAPQWRIDEDRRNRRK